MNVGMPIATAAFLMKSRRVVEEFIIQNGGRRDCGYEADVRVLSGSAYGLQPCQSGKFNLSLGP